MTPLRLIFRVLLGAVRQLFQPVLVAGALWSTVAWASWRRRKSVDEEPHARA